jgi:hypothetical protein
MSARAGGCAGTFQRGLCDGGADIQCCMPAIPIPREPAACALNGVRGTCLDARTDACSGAFVRGRCAGPKHVQCCLPPVGAPPPPTGATMLLMGDSLSVGMTAPFQRLARAAGYTPVAATKSGTTISYWRPRVAEALAAAGGRPATVLVSLGTNDSVMAKPTQQRAALAALIQAIVATGAALVWIGPPTMPARTTQGYPMHLDDTVAMIKPAVEAAGGRYFDSRSLSIPRARDGIHPTRYDAWFSAVWAWLRA